MASWLVADDVTAAPGGRHGTLLRGGRVAVNRNGAQVAD